MATEWVADFFRDVDTFQIDKLEPWFADDIDLHFGNHPAVKGKDSALHGLSEFYKTISGLHHTAEAVVGSDKEVAQQGIVTYTRTDGSLVPLPVSSYMRRNDEGKLTRLWIYIDIHPLYAEAPLS